MIANATAKHLPATSLSLLLLFGSGGCAQVKTGDLRDYHRDTMRQATACAVDPPCRDMVSFVGSGESKHGVRYGIDPGCFGYHPTCWRPWPAECPPCPPFAVMQQTPLPSEVVLERAPESGQRPSSPFVPEVAPPLEPTPLDWNSVPSPAPPGDKSGAAEKAKDAKDREAAAGTRLPPASSSKPAPAPASKLPPAPASKLPPAPTISPAPNLPREASPPADVPPPPSEGEPGVLSAPEGGDSTRSLSPPATTPLAGGTALLPEQTNRSSSGAWISSQSSAGNSPRPITIETVEKSPVGIAWAIAEDPAPVAAASQASHADGTLAGGTALLPERSNLTAGAIWPPLVGLLTPTSHASPATGEISAGAFIWIGSER